MKLIVFLGSGISLPSGLPSVQQLTHAIVNERWHRHTDGKFYPGPWSGVVSNDPTRVLQEFLALLKPFVDQCHPLDGQTGNYEDLHFLAEQIADGARSQVDNPAIHPFTVDLKEQTETLTDNLSQPIGYISDLACEFIRCVVEHKLANPRKVEGLHLIESLGRSPDVERVDILTLNHDLLIERFLEQKGIQLVDGFSGADGDVRYFDPGVFESATKVRLFKLHGSINRLAMVGLSPYGEGWFIELFFLWMATGGLGCE